MSLGCSVMPNSRFKIVGDKFLTSKYDDNKFNFNVNLLFDHSFYRPMCTHMGNKYIALCQMSEVTNELDSVNGTIHYTCGMGGLPLHRYNMEKYNHTAAFLAKLVV